MGRVSGTGLANRDGVRINAIFHAVGDERPERPGSGGGEASNREIVDPVTLPPEDASSQVGRLMAEQDISGVPIADNSPSRGYPSRYRLVARRASAHSEGLGGNAGGRRKH